MNKKTNTILTLLLGLSFILGACSDSNNNQYEVSEEWKAYQRSRITDVMLLKDDQGKDVYRREATDYGEGKYIYTRSSDFISNILDKNEFLKGGPIDGLEPVVADKSSATAIQKLANPIEKVEFDTDIVVVRYHGYYYSLTGNRIIFESQDTDAKGNKLNSPLADVTFTIGGLTEGFKTALYNMKVGEERIACIPHDMAYGTYGSGSIPGYTTLFFDIKLLEVKRDR